MSLLKERGNRKRLVVSAFLFLTLISSCCVALQPQKKSLTKLVVLHTNDHHGHPVKFFNYPAPDVGGLPARATLVSRIKKTHQNVLTLDAGDLNTGRPESNLFKAEPDILGYNAIGYDAMVLGNHEFDSPIRILKKQMEQARFPFLSANIRTTAGKPFASPYTLKDFGKFKVAVFGLTTTETKYIANPRNVRGLVFEDEIEVAKKLVPLLKKEADVIIALVHMGIFPSPQRGSKRLAFEVPGIDLIVDGHTHTRLETPVLVKNRQSGRKIPIVQAWKWGLMLGRVDFTMEGKKIADISFEAIPINLKAMGKNADGQKILYGTGEPISEDPALLRTLQPYVDKVKASLSQVIGYSEGAFSHRFARERETALGDLIADAMLCSTKDLGVDFALQNGGGIRSGLDRGPITQKAIHEILPFDNTVVVLTLKGTDLISLFDHAGSKGGETGAFPQVSRGVTFTLDSGARKCRGVRIHGKPIDPGRIYRVATNSYLADGGDGYRAFLKALDRYDTSRFQRDILIDYIKSLAGSLKPRIDGRVKVLGLEGTRRRLKRAA